MGLAGTVFRRCDAGFASLLDRRNVPESPRWLANRGRFDEARKALHYLQISDEAIERSRVAVQNEPPLPMLPRLFFVICSRPKCAAERFTPG